RDAIRVTDVTNPDAPVAVAKTPSAPDAAARRDFPSEFHSTPDLDLPPQPPASRWRIEIASSLTAADGQRLATPLVTTSVAYNDWAYLGMNGQVWKSGAGTTVPHLSRNLTDVDERVARLSPED